MKSFLRIALVFVFSIHLFSCSETSTPEQNEPQEGTVVNGKKNGLFITEKNDKVANKINYKDGVRHGLAQDFYESGNLRSDIMYVEGKKHGEAIFYHADGVTPYRINSYINGKREGVQYKYHKNGELLSQVEYFDNHPGKGLIEYSQSGREKELKVKIITEEKKVRGKKVLRVHISNKSQKVAFYIGSLTGGKFLNHKLTSIDVGKGYGELDLSKYKGQDITITANYQTRYSNDYISSIVYHVK